MRSRDATRCPDKADRLTCADSIPRRYQLLAQMEIGAQDAGTVIQVDDVTGQKEGLDEEHFSVCRRYDRVTKRPAQVQAHVPTGHLTIEHPPIAESTRHPTFTRHDEALTPERGRTVRASGRVTGSGAILIELCLIFRIEGRTEARRYAELLVLVRARRHRDRGGKPLLSTRNVDDPNGGIDLGSRANGGSGEAFEYAVSDQTKVKFLSCRDTVHTEHRRMG